MTKSECGRAPLECPKDIPGTLRALMTFQYAHAWMLLFWIAFGLMFLIMERLMPVARYALMHAPADDFIPFNECFIVWYLFWFAELFWTHYLLAVYHPAAFRRMESFVMLTYFAAILCYKLFPNAQQLRPTAFARDNAFTRAVAFLYLFDTPTNVCPSIHVMGALACWEGVRDCEDTSSPAWRWGFGAATFMVCAATVFLKQHSMWDVLAALPFCAFADWLCYRSAYALK